MKSLIVFLFMEVTQLVLDFWRKLTKNLRTDLKKNLETSSWFFLLRLLVLLGACFDQGQVLPADQLLKFCVCMLLGPLI